MIAALMIWLLLAPAAVGLVCQHLGLPVGPSAILAVAVALAVAWLGLRVLERL